MLVFNFLIPYFASLSAFCERKREHSTKKSPHLDTKVRGGGDATMPAAVLRWAAGGLGRGGGGKFRERGDPLPLFQRFSARH